MAVCVWLCVCVPKILELLLSFLGVWRTVHQGEEEIELRVKKETKCGNVRKKNLIVMVESRNIAYAMSISIYMWMNETQPSRIQDELFA